MSLQQQSFAKRDNKGAPNTITPITNGFNFFNGTTNVQMLYQEVTIAGVRYLEVSHDDGITQTVVAQIPLDQIVFDDQVLVSDPTGNVTLTFTASTPTGTDNQVNYTVKADVNYCELVSALPDNGGIVALTDKIAVTDGTTCELKTLPTENVTYSTEAVAFPTSPLAGDEHFTTTTGDETGTVINQYIFNSNGLWQLRPKTDIYIPTPKLNFRNSSRLSVISGTDVNSFNGVAWEVPQLSAAVVSPNDAYWRTLKPTIELIFIDKNINKQSANSTRGRRYVHPVNQNGQPINAVSGANVAGGKTFTAGTNSTWMDRFTEWDFTSTLSNVWQALKGFDPHAWYSFGGNDLSVGTGVPLTGAINSQSFYDKFWVAPKAGPVRGNLYFSVCIRLRVHNPLFIAGTPNQNPYLYSDYSNEVVIRPQRVNLFDGQVDSQGNNIVNPYYIHFKASNKNSGQ